MAVRTGVRGGAVLILSAILALSGCEKGGSAPISAGERFTVNPNFDEVYSLGGGDKIRVTVFGEPQLGGEYAVSGDGAVSLPLVGDVSVAGKTTRQVAQKIQGLLANGYLRSPQVSIEIVTFRPFFILGEVKSPGQYPYVNGLTVTNAIATAQGFTPRAQKKYVLIRRFGDQNEQEYVLTPDLRVRPGDTIRLSERYF